MIGPRRKTQCVLPYTTHRLAINNFYTKYFVVSMVKSTKTLSIEYDHHWHSIYFLVWCYGKVRCSTRGSQASCCSLRQQAAWITNTITPHSQGRVSGQSCSLPSASTYQNETTLFSSTNGIVLQLTEPTPPTHASCARREILRQKVTSLAVRSVIERARLTAWRLRGASYRCWPGQGHLHTMKDIRTGGIPTA